MVKLVLEEMHHWLAGAAHPFVFYNDQKNLENLEATKPSD